MTDHHNYTVGSAAGNAIRDFIKPKPKPKPRKKRKPPKA